MLHPIGKVAITANIEVRTQRSQRRGIFRHQVDDSAFNWALCQRIAQRDRRYRQEPKVESDVDIVRGTAAMHCYFLGDVVTRNLY